MPLIIDRRIPPTPAQCEAAGVPRAWIRQYADQWRATTAPCPLEDPYHAEIPSERIPPSGTVSTRLRWAVFRRDGFSCQECGIQDDLTADHIIPKSKGGPTTLENLQTLCRSCNSQKGTKL